MKKYKIASIAGDGIGKEVVPESLKVLKEAAKKHQFNIHFDEFDFASCDYYKKNGKMLQMIGKKKLANTMLFILEQSVIQKKFLIILVCGGLY